MMILIAGGLVFIGVVAFVYLEVQAPSGAKRWVVDKAKRQAHSMPVDKLDGNGSKKLLAVENDCCLRTNVR